MSSRHTGEPLSGGGLTCGSWGDGLGTRGGGATGHLWYQAVEVVMLEAGMTLGVWMEKVGVPLQG